MRLFGSPEPECASLAYSNSSFLTSSQQTEKMETSIRNNLGVLEQVGKSLICSTFDELLLKNLP